VRTKWLAFYAVFAALLAAVPLAAPYWACIVGIGELWLVDGEPTAALVFAVLAYVPTMFIDDEFYKQLK
jgi:hypothetical protein